MEKQQKICKNCKYYSAHFIKYKTRLKQVGGQCFNPEVKTANPERACNLWENNQAEKAERKKQIFSAIETMRKELEEISMILKDDCTQ